MPQDGVIRVEIDDFEDLHEVQELEKPVEIGNLNWTLGAFSETSSRTNHVRHLGLVLYCNKASRSNLWSVTASVQLKLVKIGSENDSHTKNVDFEFKSGSKMLEVADFLNWQVATCPENGFVADRTAVVEAHVHVKYVEGIHSGKKSLETFEEPRGKLTDVELIVEGKSLHVGKQILANYSKYFCSLFFSDFIEKSAAKIKLEEISHSEFVDLLNLIYPSQKVIDAQNIKHLLKLADRFEVPFVMEKCEKYLISTPDFHLVDKLQYAEMYRFSGLQDSCLEQLKTSKLVLALADHQRYLSLGDITRNLINQILFECLQNEK